MLHRDMSLQANKSRAGPGTAWQEQEQEQEQEQKQEKKQE